MLSCCWLPQLSSIQLVWFSSHERMESCADEKTAGWCVCLPYSYGPICSLRVLYASGSLSCGSCRLGDRLEPDGNMGSKFFHMWRTCSWCHENEQWATRSDPYTPRKNLEDRMIMMIDVHMYHSHYSYYLYRSTEWCLASWWRFNKHHHWRGGLPPSPGCECWWSMLFTLVKSKWQNSKVGGQPLFFEVVQGCNHNGFKEKTHFSRTRESIWSGPYIWSCNWDVIQFKIHQLWRCLLPWAGCLTILYVACGWANVNF